MTTLYVRLHAKSGIHKINHCPNYKGYKEHKKTSANYYWQPPFFVVIMLQLCTDQSANDNQCETKHQYYFNF